MDVVDAAIRKARKLGATQQQVAAAMGTTQSAISQREARMRMQENGELNDGSRRPNANHLAGVQRLIAKLQRRAPRK